jgi:hypothetical protein
VISRAAPRRTTSTRSIRRSLRLASSCSASGVATGVLWRTQRLLDVDAYLADTFERPLAHPAALAAE